MPHDRFQSILFTLFAAYALLRALWLFRTAIDPMAALKRRADRRGIDFTGLVTDIPRYVRRQRRICTLVGLVLLITAVWLLYHTYARPLGLR